MKLKNHIGSIVFLVAATASALYGAFVDRESVGTRSRDRNEARVFPSFDRAVLSRVEIERDGTKLALEREQAGSTFRMTSPSAGTTDGASVDQLLGALELATIVRRVPDASADALKPRAKGTLTFGSKVVRFTLGSAAPVPQGASYLEVEGVGTVVAGRELASELMRPFDAYRDRTLVPLAPSDIVRFETKAGENGFAIERLDSSSFRVVGGGRVGRDITERFLAAVPELRAVSFLSPEAMATDKASERALLLVGSDGRRVQLRFGAPCAGAPDDVMVLVDSPERAGACVPRVVVAAFDVAPALLADRRLFFARPDEVTDIALEAANGSALSFARVGSGFRERRPDSRELDQDESEAAGALLARVIGATGTVVAAPPDGTAVAVRVVVGRVGTDTPERLEIADRDGGAIAKRGADGVWLALSPSTRRAFEPATTGIRAHSVLPRAFAPARASRIAIKCGGRNEVLVRTDGSFAYEQPRGLPADGARVIELLEAWGKARARDVIAAREGDSRAKDPCTLTFGWAGDAAVTESTLTLRSPEGDAGAGAGDLLVRRDGAAEWLVVDPSLWRTFDEPLVDRGSLAMSGEAETLVLVRAPKRADETRVRLALRELRASRIERVGGVLPDEGFASPSFEVKVAGEVAAPVIFRFVRSRTPNELLVRRSDMDVTFRISDDALPAEVR